MAVKPLKKFTEAETDEMIAESASQKTFVTVLELARETKNTLRFENHDDNAPINPLYIQKAVFGGVTPTKVLISVTF